MALKPFQKNWFGSSANVSEDAPMYDVGGFFSSPAPETNYAPGTIQSQPVANLTPQQTKVPATMPGLARFGAAPVTQGNGAASAQLVKEQIPTAPAQAQPSNAASMLDVFQQYNLANQKYNAMPQVIKGIAQRDMNHPAVQNWLAAYKPELGAKLATTPASGIMGSRGGSFQNDPALLRQLGLLPQ